jgi:hypothetical protein
LCAIDEYCVSERDSGDWGKCKGYEGDILGERCDPLVTCTSPTTCGVKKGLNEKLFCGKAVFDATGNVSLIEWVGFCNKGKCQECEVGNDKCSGRGYVCRLGKFVHSPLEEDSAAFGWEFFAINPVNWSTFWTFAWLYFFFPIGFIILGIIQKRTGIKLFGGEGGAKETKPKEAITDSIELAPPTQTFTDKRKTVELKEVASPAPIQEIDPAQNNSTAPM